MTSIYVDYNKELKARMEAGITANKIIAKDVFIGFFADTTNRKPNDYPILMIVPQSGNSTPKCSQGQSVDTMTTSIVYIMSKLDINDNILYKESDTTGILYQLSHILNYVEKKTTDGSIDLTINNTTYSLLNYSWRLDYSTEKIIKLIVTLTHESKLYVRGAR